MQVWQLACVGALLAIGGCARADTAHPVEASWPGVLAPTDAPETHGAACPPLGTLRSRHHTIHVYAGPRFTVDDAAGRRLATLVTDAELRAELPALHRDLHQTYAERPLWAGCRSRNSYDWADTVRVLEAAKSSPIR